MRACSVIRSAKARCLRELVAVCVVACAPQAEAVESTTTAALLAQAVATYPACSAWHVSGICFWLRCTPVGCSIRTSTRVSHFAPDLVVSTYHDVATHPWPEIGIPISAASGGFLGTLLGVDLADSAGTHSQADRTDKQRRFRDADAIGHPAAGLPDLVTCPSAVIPFVPYYQSKLDAAVWRSYLPAELLLPASWVPEMREVGNWPLNTWGNVYPRTGEVVQQHEVKAAAVLSQRVADFITRPAQPHVYAYVASGGTRRRRGQLVWDPPPARENDPMGGLWQMNVAVPTPCHIFGLNDTASPASYGDAMTTHSGSYAYTLWRPYACCRVRGQIFLGSIQFGLW